MAAKRASTQAPTPQDSPAKKPKLSNNHDEHPDDYSDAVRQKLQDTSKSRTGQACDRCKERKMRCDPNPLGCKPCQDKNVPCRTTDRITGKASERGHTERLEAQLEMLRRQLGQYVSRFGQMEGAEDPMNGGFPEYAPDGYSRHNSIANTQSSNQQYSEEPSSEITRPHGLAQGPITGTVVDVMGSKIDIASFHCPMMDEPITNHQPVFNNNRYTFTSTILGGPKPSKPNISKQDALGYVRTYLGAVNRYVGTVHPPSFLALVHRCYDDESFKPSVPEEVQLHAVFAIVAFQMAIRNPSIAEAKQRESNHCYHYALGFFRELHLDSSLAAMQAMNLLLVYQRNLPKPGNAWNMAARTMVRTFDLDFHRSASKVGFQGNMLQIELRKRVFWSNAVIAISISLKFGKPMPFRMQDIDVELPLAIDDSEISDAGISRSLSGKCNWRPAYLGARLVPIFLDLYNKVISDRLSGPEYEKTVDQLQNSIDQWESDWFRESASDDQDESTSQGTNLYMSSWAAEYRLLLHHPSQCTSTSQAFINKSLDICHEASLRLLRNLQSLFEKFKGADFTWNSTVIFVLAAGTSIYVYDQRKQSMTRERFATMQQELTDWLRILQTADKILGSSYVSLFNHPLWNVILMPYCPGSGDFLYRSMLPHVEKCLQDARNILLASAALQNGYNAAASSSHHDPVAGSSTAASTPAQSTRSLDTNTTAATTVTQQSQYSLHPPPPFFKTESNTTPDPTNPHIPHPDQRRLSTASAAYQDPTISTSQPPTTNNHTHNHITSSTAPDPSFYDYSTPILSSFPPAPYADISSNHAPYASFASYYPNPTTAPPSHHPHSQATPAADPANTLMSMSQSHHHHHGMIPGSGSADPNHNAGNSGNSNVGGAAGGAGGAGTITSVTWPHNVFTDTDAWRR
ncbi:MAG: hypothetical protein Q9227_000235 [Pyrenula ochraceoflavens]